MGFGNESERDAAPLSAASFHVLLALADGESHGYAIIKEVEETTGGAVRLGPGTLYRVIKQMLADEWLVEIETPDERRRTYRLTERGFAVARGEAMRLDALVDLARRKRILAAVTQG